MYSSLTFVKYKNRKEVFFNMKYVEELYLNSNIANFDRHCLSKE